MNEKQPMNFYYRIWMDCITRLKSNEANKDSWQAKSMVIMTTAMVFNLILFMIILQKHILGYYFYEFNIPFLSGHVNYILTILVLYIAPCVVVNYLSIFRGKRYEKLLEKYPYYKGKLILTYILISILLPVILLWIGVFIS